MESRLPRNDAELPIYADNTLSRRFGTPAVLFHRIQADIINNQRHIWRTKSLVTTPYVHHIKNKTAGLHTFVTVRRLILPLGRRLEGERRDSEET